MLTMARVLTMVLNLKTRPTGVTKEILNMLKAILTQSGHLIGKRQPLEAGVCRESVSFSVQSGSVDSRYSISLVLHLSPDCPMSQDCSEDYKGPRTPL